MVIESLFNLCVTKVCENLETYSDILNELSGEVPHTVLDTILGHHIRNCLTVEVEYIELRPDPSFNYFERSCVECYPRFVWNNHSVVTKTMYIQKTVWDKIRYDYECEYCYEPFTIYFDESCNCP